MKGEQQHFIEDVKVSSPHHHHSSMFASLHHPHHQQQHLHHQLQQLNHHECHVSDEEDSHSSDGGIAIGNSDDNTPNTTPNPHRSLIKKMKTDHLQDVGGGDSIEVAKRPRGRPPGSKNKPKPPVIITRDAECAMRPHVIEIQSGSDIIDSLSRFARQRNIGLCVLSASGSVASVSLRQPSTTSPNSTVTFHGRFDILSISVTHLPPPSSTPFPNGLAISLAGPQGQIFGGSVVGGLIAAGAVYIVATSFTNPSFHRLPVEDECFPSNEPQTTTSSAGGGGGVAGGDNHVVQPVQPMYSCHLPSDVIWAPTPTRHQQTPPPPPQHPY